MKPKKILLLNFLLLLLIIASVGYNQVVLAKIQNKLGISMLASFNFLQTNTGISLSGDSLQDAIELVISQGQPSIYGAELGVSFDSVQQSITTMAQFDPGYGRNKIVLAGNDLQRYIDVALKISCEYCCSAKSIVFPNGQAACGCAHSQAMRGLLSYLIVNYGSSYSNDELLRELSLWKGMYFPKQMIAKLSGQLQGQTFTPDTASLTLGVNLPDYGVGSKRVPLPSEIQNLPSMVGGC